VKPEIVDFVMSAFEYGVVGDHPFNSGT
jgi:hypothetical protein